MRVPMLRMRWLWIAGFACVVAWTGSPARARVVLVGVDGGSWNVVDPLLEAGELPNLAAVVRDGVTAELETVEPVTSPVVWTSIATGRSPEAHGVRDFFSTGLDVRVPTVFERLAARGVRVGLYDYLMTWPPVSPPGGFVIPGWLRRDATVEPRDVWERAGVEPWVTDYDRLKTSEDYRRNGVAETQRKAERWNALAAAFDVEVGAVSFYAIDAMSHRFWHGAYPDAFEPEVAALASGPQRTALFDAWRAIDRQLGEIRATLGPGDTLLIASDHGFQTKGDSRNVWVSNVQAAARAAGLDPERDGFSFVTEFGQLVVRVRPGPFEQAERTSARLAALIESCRGPDGAGLFWAAEVLDVAERPPGLERPLANRLRQWAIRTLLDLAFDVEIDPSAHAILLALPRAGVLEELSPDALVEVNGAELPLRDVFSRQAFTGEHHPIGIFLAAGGPIAAREERDRISVLDIAPLIFHLAGSPVPDDLEGRVPARWLEADALAERPVRSLPAADMPGIGRAAATEGGAGDPELIEKLRRLGYVE